MRWPWALPLLPIGVALAACGGSTPVAAVRELRLAVRADVTGLYPQPSMQDETYTYDVNGNVFEGLVQFDGHLKPQPSVAESWDNPDDRTYRFRLRPGLRFSDGRPVTAEDVAASLLVPGERGFATRGYLDAVESVRALDPLTVDVRARTRNFLLLHRLHWGFVLPAAELSRDPVKAPGTGPYAVEAWHPGRELVLVRNEHYWGSRPPYDRVRLRVEPDAARRIALLEGGEADVIDQVPLDRVEELRRKPGLQVSSGPSLRVLFLALRVDRPPFSDPRLREAVDLAIDREELVHRAYGGHTVRAAQMVPSSVIGHDPEIPVVVPDRTRARSLLASAGFPGGLDLRLDGTFNRYVNDRAILDELARQLAEAGIRVTVNALDKADFYKLVYPPGPGSDLHLLGWECPSGDAGQLLDGVLHSRGGRLGTSNSTALADAELDGLAEAANVTTDPIARVAVLQKAIRRAASVRATLPLLVQAEAVAFSGARVRWTPGLRRSLRLAEMAPASTEAPAR
jgi:peptide/nickel transport system substrate-binding protein